MIHDDDVISIGLYNKGLIYLIIPIADEDTIVVPPLQVSRSVSSETTPIATPTGICNEQSTRGLF